MKKVKVFTKYDTPFEKVILPYFEDLQAYEFSLNSYVSEADFNIGYQELTIEKIEEGLEGIRFFTYGVMK